MPGFEYTPTNLTELERTLSRDRLAPYLAYVGGNQERAVRLYEQNTALAEALYGILQGLEIALRNAIHEQMTLGLGVEAWWTVVTLGPEQQSMIRKAEDALRREGKPPDAGRVIAELSFGFWTGITGPKYADLWRNYLVKAFARRPVQRIDVHTRLNSIRKLRNRVAHHEPILFSGRLVKYTNQIFDTISWMSPITARWVRSNSPFDTRYLHYQHWFPSIRSGRP
jgi:hypothetical protein